MREREGVLNSKEVLSTGALISGTRFIILSKQEGSMKNKQGQQYNFWRPTQQARKTAVIEYLKTL